MPIFNVDGVAYIEENWVKDHKIPAKRKNMNPSYKCLREIDFTEGGVDLNRNFGIDFGQIDDIVNY